VCCRGFEKERWSVERKEKKRTERKAALRERTPGKLSLFVSAISHGLVQKFLNVIEKVLNIISHIMMIVIKK
jgi:hypothetical protein